MEMFAAGIKCVSYIHQTNWSGWWFQPFRKILVSWDYYSQYMEKMFQTTNQYILLQDLPVRRCSEHGWTWSCLANALTLCTKDRCSMTSNFKGITGARLGRIASNVFSSSVVTLSSLHAWRIGIHDSNPTELLYPFKQLFHIFSGSFRYVFSTDLGISRKSSDLADPAGS